MNPFNVRVEVLEGPAPQGSVFKSADVSLRQQTKTWVEQASMQALKLVKQAHQKAKIIQEDAVHLGAQQKAEVIEALRTEAKAAALEEALQWLVEERALEARVVESVESQMREAMATVLEEWVDDQDELEQLARRLTALAAARVRQHPYKLRLHPETCKTLQAEHEGKTPFERAQWVSDATLAVGQVVLEDPFLRVEFDVAMYWSKVVDALRTMQIDSA